MSQYIYDIIFGILDLNYHAEKHRPPRCSWPEYERRYERSCEELLLVSHRIRSATKFPQNVLHYIWHTSRVYVIQIKSLSRYFQLTQNWTDKAKWRSIEASNNVNMELWLWFGNYNSMNVNKHTGHGLLAVDSRHSPPPPNKFRFS